ncbi:hypothetical protein RUM44_002263 [Polyplax serrata]|uniref:Uncharacterized protein n=1 Tax=Polyplax serrata TaxID=468196 RepID=A0ABR1AME9_POLSC
MLLKCVTLGLLLVASVHGDNKADLAPAETRVGPHFYGGVPHFVTPLEGYVAPVVEPALYAGPYEAEALTYGAGELTDFYIKLLPKQQEKSIKLLEESY